MTCETCRHAWYNAAFRAYYCDKRGGTKLPGLKACIKWEAKQ